MQVQQIIQASADGLTITRLAPGNVYKRVEENGYSGESTLRFGVVQDVMNNGSEAAITALEYEADYNGITAKMKVFTGSKPVAIYPAHPEEVRTHLANLQATADRKVTEATRALTQAQETAAAVARVLEQVGSLSAAETALGGLDASAVEE